MPSLYNVPRYNMNLDKAGACDPPPPPPWNFTKKLLKNDHNENFIGMFGFAKISIPSLQLLWTDIMQRHHKYNVNV